MREIKSCSLQAIGGVEIDCVEPEYEYDKEMLVYFPHEYEHAKKRMHELRALRIRRMEFYIKKAISEFGLKEFSIEDLRKIKAEDRVLEPIDLTFLKPDLLKYLKRSYPETFMKMDIIQFKKEYIKKWEIQMNKEWDSKLNIKQIADIAKRDEAIMVVPHLGLRFGKTLDQIRKNAEKYRKFLVYCKNLQVWGVELYYYKEFEHEPKVIQEINEFMKEISKEFGFRFTYGSDCHGINSESDTMEKYYGDFSGF